MKFIKENKKFVIIGLIILALVGVSIYSKPKNNNKDKISTKNGEVKIVKNDVSKISLEDYSNDLFKMKIPTGWKVDVLGDYIHYTIRAYNPENPTYQFFINLKSEGYNKSEDAKKFKQKYYPNDLFAKTSVIASKDTEGFYKIFNEFGEMNNTEKFTFPVLTDFTVIENMGTSMLGGDVLRASFKDANNKEAEGIFTAYVYDAGPYYVNENIMSGKKIDIYFLSVYDAIFITAPKDELINWEETLSSIFASLEFTDTFLNNYNKEQDAVMKNFQSIRSICNEISDGIMDSWEKRSKSYDIMSQKQSDATLGYERVYDTENGEIYKAYNGFTDDYDGERYKSITEDMYTEKTSGYIEK